MEKIVSLGKSYTDFMKQVEEWITSNSAQLAIFNMILVLLVLMRSAGYFLPFFPITINMIVTFQLILSVLILKLNSKALFSIGLFFWALTFFLKISPASFWAERIALYSYETLVIASCLLVIEIIHKK